MAEDAQQDQQRNWLIKSSTRILGPFTFDEVVNQLRSKQVSVIDELRQPEGRWSYIRENPQFLEIIKTIRDEDSSEHTMTQSLAQHTAITRTDITQLTDDLTPTPIPHRGHESPESNIKDITPAYDLPSPAGIRVGGFERSYGLSSDRRVLARIRRRSQMVRIAAIALGLVIVFSVFSMMSRKSSERVMSYDEMIAHALRYKSMGLYSKSLELYNVASKMKEPDLETQVEMANLLISEDRQSLYGRRVLERALVQDGRTRAEVVQAYIGIAVSYMMDGDLKQAEDTLQKAIGYEPFNISALLNMAIIQLKKGHYGSAMRDFDAIYRKSPETTLALFGRAMAGVEYAKEENDSHILSTLVREIKSNLHKTSYLRQELILLLVYAQSLLNDVDGVNQSVVQFLSQLPGQVEKFIHPLDVDWRFTQWDYLERYCSEIYTKQTPHPELKALRSVCLMEAKRDGNAQRLLSEALAEAPKDPYVIVTQAAYLVRVGRYPEAQMVLKAPEVQSLPIKNLLLGDICIKVEDTNCAHAYFSQVYTQNRRSAHAIHGLAWVVGQAGDKITAYDYIRAGLLAEPNYLPLLELREQLESQ